jgi:hypothetical protein
MCEENAGSFDTEDAKVRPKEILDWKIDSLKTEKTEI